MQLLDVGLASGSGAAAGPLKNDPYMYMYTHIYIYSSDII